MKPSKYIDHTMLQPFADEASIQKLCSEAAAYDFASVCVNPGRVELAAALLKDTDVNVCTVIGFPLGANTAETKVFETADAIAKGADEIDMVINVGKLKDGDDQYVTEEIKAVREACGSHLLKVIIETGLLTDEEKVQACLDAKAAGADYVKTCTGFTKGSATVEDVRLMRQTVGADMGVKASGGVRTKEDFRAMIEAGATRIGTSSGVKLI